MTDCFNTSQGLKLLYVDKSQLKGDLSLKDGPFVYFLSDFRQIT